MNMTTFISHWMRPTRLTRPTCRTLLLCAIFFSACSFLEENPQSALTQEQAYSSLSALERNAVLSIYQYIGGSADSQGLQGTGRGVYDLNSLTTDEQIMPTRGGDWYDGGYWQRLHYHTWQADDQSIRDTWNYLFKVAMLADNGIYAVQSYDKADKDEQKQAQWIAELRALRAMYYFYLMDLFGRVPIVTDTDVPVVDVQPAERAEVFEFIVKELTEAMPLLSREYSNQSLGSYYGRMTYYVACFVMAKLALNKPVYCSEERSFPVVYEDDSVVQVSAYEAVVKYADILSVVYDLEESVENNFLLNNENSKENIFVIPREVGLYTARYNYFHRSAHYNHASAMGIGGENGASATLETLRVFGYRTEEQDPRMNSYFYYDTVWVNGNVVKDIDGTTPLVYYPLEVAMDLTGSKYEKTAGARLKKYEHDPNGLHDATVGRNDIVLFRYADVVLMKAEALARQGLDATEPFNQVRQRAGVRNLFSVTLQDIYEERWRELMWEGWHRNDMIRFGLFEPAYTTVFPIPQDMLRMHPDWTQNEGY